MEPSRTQVDTKGTSGGNAYTEGPWRVVTNRSDTHLLTSNITVESMASDRPFVVATCPLDSKVDLANAYLISTVPELLKSLELLINHVEHYATMQHANPDAHRHLAEANATIRRAKQEG